MAQTTEDTIENLVISELMYDPKGANSDSSEWIEFYNPTNEILLLKKDTFGFKEKENASCHKIDKDINIEPGEFLIIAENKDKFKINPLYETLSDSIIIDSSFDMSSTEGVLSFSNNRCETYFVNFTYKSVWGGKDNGKSLEKKEIGSNEYSEDTWQESCIEGGTPGKENSKKEDCKEEEEEEEEEIPQESAYKNKIKINEIKAETSDEEFVEIINTGEEVNLDFLKWCVKDEIKHKKTNWDCKKPSGVVKNGIFYTLSGSFSLNNNTDGDTVYLYDENKNLVDSVSYKNAKAKFSYAFDGSAWRWTSKMTPGTENKFDKILSGKIKRDEKVYAGIYAAFEVDADSDAEKFTWDFGDSHKSYLQETRHKYEKSGKYDASLRIRGNGEEKTYNFTVKVENYDAPKVRIVKVSPNPKGKDSENEWIEIENKSKKKINLKGWGVATGWEKMTNHPIREKFEIKAGKTKKLTRDICAFTLANTKTKIELRSPDGKIVQKLKYDKKKEKLEEDEVYEETEKGEWKWIEPTPTPVPVASVSVPARAIHELPLPDELSLPDEPQPDEKELQAAVGKYSPATDGKNIAENRKRLLNHNVTIMLASRGQNFLPPTGEPRVLGAEKIKTCGNYYSFTAPLQQKHWAINFLENNWTKINQKINQLILFSLNFSF